MMDLLMKWPPWVRILVLPLIIPVAVVVTIKYWRRLQKQGTGVETAAAMSAWSAAQVVENNRRNGRRVKRP